MAGARIQLDHGAGGGLRSELIDGLIAPRLGAERAVLVGDGAGLELDVSRIAMTSETFVVDPIFFGDGDIGSLAVCASVNDLAVDGALPRYLTLALVIEQGLPIADLARVLDSVRASAAEADVEVVAGDMQVVRTGEADKLFVGVAGVGECVQPVELAAASVQPGDAVIVTGALADHGVNLLARRQGLELSEGVSSGCAALGGLVWNVLEDYAGQVRCMRELTRGGLAGVLGEVADRAGVSVELEGHRLPVARATRVGARRLGIDPLQLPSAGSLCMLVEGAAAAKVLELIRWQPQGRAAQIVGMVRERRGAGVTLVRPDSEGETPVPASPGVELPRLR